MWATKAAAAISPKLIFETMDGSPWRKSIPKAQREYSIIPKEPDKPVRWVRLAIIIDPPKIPKATSAEYSCVG